MYTVYSMGNLYLLSFDLRRRMDEKQTELSEFIEGEIHQLHLVQQAQNHIRRLTAEQSELDTLMHRATLFMLFMPTMVFFGYWNWLAKEFVRYNA